jgi:hypothetical protein
LTGREKGFSEVSIVRCKPSQITFSNLKEK